MPQQNNVVDCGIFMLLVMEHISRGVELQFQQSDIPLLRKRIVLEVTSGKLSGKY